MTITGQQIREAREAKGWSRAMLAFEAGNYSSSTARNVEIGRQKSGKAFDAIVKILGLTDGKSSNGEIRKEGSEAQAKAIQEMESIAVEPIRDSQSLDACDHYADSRPLVLASSIVGATTDGGVVVSDCDVVIPGGLLVVARDENLTVKQVLTLCRVHQTFVQDGGRYDDDTSVDHWRQFYKDMKEWL